MSALKQRLQEDMKHAMKAKEKQRLAAIRLILAALKQKEVDERIVLDDDMIMAILRKLAKQRKESISQYQKAERLDLVAQEEFELDLINQYLPAPMSADDVAQCIDQAISQSDAQSIKDMGKVMAILQTQLQGGADMAEVSKLVKAKLLS